VQLASNQETRSTGASQKVRQQTGRETQSLSYSRCPLSFLPALQKPNNGTFKNGAKR